MEPKISVIMPVLNAGNTVAAALNSISTQSFGDFEIIVIDNGSTDATRDEIEAARRCDGRIRTCVEPERGIVPALKRGLRDVRACLTARMDADDEALPERFAKQYAYLTAKPEMAVVGTAIIMTDLHGQATTITLPTEPGEITTRLLSLDGFWALAHPTALMRTDIVRQVSGYRANFPHAEDYDLWLRIAERAPIGNLPEPLLRYSTTNLNSRPAGYRMAQLMGIATAYWAAWCRRKRSSDPFGDIGPGASDDEVDLALGSRSARFWLDYLFLLSSLTFSQAERAERLPEILRRLSAARDECLGSLQTHFLALPWTEFTASNLTAAAKSAAAKSAAAKSDMPRPEWFEIAIEGLASKSGSRT